MRGIHRWPVNFPHKEPVTRKMFPFDDIIMIICESNRQLEMSICSKKGVQVGKLYLMSGSVNTYNVMSHFKWAQVAGKSVHMVKYNKIHLIKSFDCLLMYAFIRAIWMPLVPFWWHDILGNITIFHKPSPFWEPSRNFGVIAIEFLVVINIHFFQLDVYDTLKYTEWQRKVNSCSYIEIANS